MLNVGRAIRWDSALGVGRHKVSDYVTCPEDLTSAWIRSISWSLKSWISQFGCAPHMSIAKFLRIVDPCVVCDFCVKLDAVGGFGAVRNTYKGAQTLIYPCEESESPAPRNSHCVRRFQSPHQQAYAEKYVSRTTSNRC